MAPIVGTVNHADCRTSLGSFERLDTQGVKDSNWTRSFPGDCEIAAPERSYVMLGMMIDMGMSL